MSTWRRIASIGALATKVTGAQLNARVRGALRRVEDRSVALEGVNVDNARRVVETLGQMKGAAMKMGQQLAIAAQNFEHLPDEVHTILGELNASASPVPFSVIEAVLEREFEGDVVAIFSDITPEPLGTASLAQAHLARLASSGEEVVVKVLHDGIEGSVKADLMALKALLLGGRLLGRDAEEVSAVFSELQARLEEELDYLQEAVNIAEFVRLFGDDPRVTIPRVYGVGSTGRVLTMDRVPGVPLAQFLETSSSDVRQRAGLNLAELFFEMAFVHRTLHADPHPGNYLFQPDGRVSMLDFGCVKRFDEFWMGTYASAILAALDGRREDLLTACRELGAWVGDDPRAGEIIWKFCETVVGPWRDGPCKLDANDMLKQTQPIVREMWRYREIRGPRDIIFLHRTLGGLYTLEAA